MFLNLLPESTLPKNGTVIPEGAQRLSGISKRMGCQRASPVMDLQERREPFPGGLRAASLLRDTLQKQHRVRCRSVAKYRMIICQPLVRQDRVSLGHGFDVLQDLLQ